MKEPMELPDMNAYKKRNTDIQVYSLCKKCGKNYAPVEEEFCSGCLRQIKQTPPPQPEHGRIQQYAIKLPWRFQNKSWKLSCCQGYEISVSYSIQTRWTWSISNGKQILASDTSYAKQINAQLDSLRQLKKHLGLSSYSSHFNDLLQDN